MKGAPPERLPVGTGFFFDKEPEVFVQAIVAIEEKRRKPQLKNEKDFHRAALDYWIFFLE